MVRWLNQPALKSLNCIDIAIHSNCVCAVKYKGLHWCGPTTPCLRNVNAVLRKDRRSWRCLFISCRGIEIAFDYGGKSVGAVGFLHVNDFEIGY